MKPAFTLLSTLLALNAVFLTSLASANTDITNRIDNPGFEDRFDDWNDFEPSGISTIENSGRRSGKITGSAGSIRQFVDISPNRDYELSAYIRGNGRLRAKVNNVNYSEDRGRSSTYRKVTVQFNSGNVDRFEIWCEYNGQTCRFDDIELFELSGGGSSGSNGSLPIDDITASVSSANAFNAVDGDLSTRWGARSRGNHLTIDLGETHTVSSVDLAFFRGNQRTAFFDILVGNSTGNLTRVYSGASSGNTLNPESFNFSDRSGRYVRFVGLGNSSSSWSTVTEFSVFGSAGGDSGGGDSGGDDSGGDDSGGDDSGGGNSGGDDSGGGGGGSGTASAILGGGWKLNGFSGSLRVGNNDNGLDYADDASLSESHFFFERNGYAAFRCYPGSPTSGGSSNPRSETREQIDGGDGFWDGNSNTTRTMKWRFRVEDLPPSGKLCFGQIHERNDSFDDIIRVQVEGSESQNSGSVDLRILGYVTEEVLGSGQTVNFNMSMDTEYYFELTMRNGVVTLYNLNNSGNRTQTLFRSEDIGDADECYFKAGCYLQSTRSSHSDSNDYGQVLIRDLSVNPDD